MNDNDSDYEIIKIDDNGLFIPQTIDELKKIDYWTSEQYKQYYTKLIPIYRDWYMRESMFRPVVIGNNITHRIEDKYITKKKSKGDCAYNNEEHLHYLASSGSKLAYQLCPYSVKRNKQGEIMKKKLRLSTEGTFSRYKDYWGRVLYNIEDIINKPNILKTARTFYYYTSYRPCILKDTKWEARWNQVVAMNFVFDIDITDKDKVSLFDMESKWGHSRYCKSFEMLTEVCEILDKLDIKYRIQTSGNGWYVILEKIDYAMNTTDYSSLYYGDDFEQQVEVVNDDRTTSYETRIVKKHEAFWHKVIAGMSLFKKEYFKEINNKYQKYFKFDFRTIAPANYVKTPYSLHQRLDIVAKPTNLDEINDNTDKEFMELCNPNRVLVMPNTDFFKEWKDSKNGDSKGLLTELDRQVRKIKIDNPTEFHKMESTTTGNQFDIMSTGPNSYRVRNKIRGKSRNGKMVTSFKYN